MRKFSAVLLGLCLLCGVLLGAGGCKQDEGGKDVPANPLEKEGYTLIFNDEFDGEELDYAKASLILFDDFRSGKIGKITLEWVPEEGK